MSGFANGIDRRVACVPEAAFGDTPATPAFKVLRVSPGGGLQTEKLTAVAEEEQPDRNVREEVELGQDVAGQYGFELTYGSWDDVFAAGMFADWVGNVLKNGRAEKCLTFEETLTVGEAEHYSRFPGGQVASWGLNVVARKPVAGTVSIMAEREILDAAPIAGATYAAPNTKPISTASANVSNLVLGGGLPTPKIRSVSFTVQNNLRTREVVGSKYSDEFGYGAADITGTIEAYFDGNAFYQKALDHATGTLGFKIGNAANEKYQFDFLNIQTGNAKRAPGAKGSDVMVRLPWRAKFDPGTGCSMRITRAVA
jgi:hypothetical protein